MADKTRYFVGKREITYEEYLKLTGQEAPEKEATKEIKPKKKK